MLQFAKPTIPIPTPRKRKYHNHICLGCDQCGVTINEDVQKCPVCKSTGLIFFHSKAERRRWTQLRLLERAGEIQNLKLQEPFPLVVNGLKIGVYYADFSYVEVRTETAIIEDIKGISTAVYKLKKRLVNALYGVDIVELSAKQLRYI